MRVSLPLPSTSHSLTLTTVQWVDSGISVWFFPRSSIPSDITASTPVPDGWGKPLAHWPATDCAPATFFKDHVQIFDTTLCGDWAGSVWNDSGAPGQEQSCAARVGVSTCEEFVRNNGASFSEACEFLSRTQPAIPYLY